MQGTYAGAELIFKELLKVLERENAAVADVASALNKLGSALRCQVGSTRIAGLDEHARLTA